jgi:hypothetical protein
MSMFYVREGQIRSRTMSLLELGTRVATMPPMPLNNGKTLPIFKKIYLQVCP